MKKDIPDCIKKHLVDGEKIEKIYKHPRRIFWVRYLIAIVLCWTIIIPLIIVIVIEVQVRCTHFAVTNKRVSRLFSFVSRDFVDTNYSDIKNVYYKQNVAERMLGVARIYLSTAGTEGLEMKIGPVSEYIELHKSINSKRLE